MATPAAALPRVAAPAVKPQVHWHDRLAQGLLLVCCLGLVVFLLAPMAAILVKSVQDSSGAFVGLKQFQDYFATPALRSSIWNTLWVASA
ncbi:MAG: putative 2-aminoethylphosphonate ABC transporter permease subunit, partial [Panacagrimonas sp.]